MKVNTDSLILGSWVTPMQAQTLLDIGTGTGILALMLAQQMAKSAHMYALEVDNDAATQAAENFANSPFKEKITLIHNELALFTSASNFDVIVSNPPYFDASVLPTRAYQKQSRQRHIARQTTALPPQTLFDFIQKHLTADGSAYCIYPYSVQHTILALAQRHGLSAQRLLNIKHSAGREPYLTAFHFRCQTHVSGQGMCETLLIRDENGEYSAAYKSLCQPFYLHF